MGRGGGDETGTAHVRLLVALGRRSTLLPLTDDGRGGVARAGPFSTLGKGDYRGMGFFILFFSFLFCSGGVRIGKIARGVRLLGGLMFTLGGRDCILARRRHLLGGGQGIVFRQAAHGTAVGFAR